MKLDLTKAFDELFQEVDQEKSALFIDVQKFLLKGEPLELDVLVNMFNTTLEKINILIEQFGELNQEGKVVAFAGLSIKPTNHSFKVNNQQLYTWCAADAIIFPSLLNVSAEIKSTDPMNGNLVSMTVDRKIIKKLQPETAHISWIEDRDIKNIRTSMCNRVHFFESQQTAKSWNQQNVDASIFPVKNLLNTVDTEACC